MNATLLDPPAEMPQSSVCCENCPAVQRLERAIEKLSAEFRCEVGYWKSRHADAVQRIEQLKEELDQSRGQTRALQAKLFGRKSEKSASSDRSNDLFDPEEVPAAAKKRGAQRRTETDRADVASDLRGDVGAESVRRTPSGRRDPMAGIRAFGREKRPWVVAVGDSRCGHRDLSAVSQSRSRGAGSSFWARGLAP